MLIGSVEFGVLALDLQMEAAQGFPEVEEGEPDERPAVLRAESADPDQLEWISDGNKRTAGSRAIVCWASAGR